MHPRGLEGVGGAYRSVAIALLALLVVSCGNVAAPATTNGPSPRQTLSLEVGIPHANTGETDAYWALEQGIWKRLGLEVTFVHQGATQSTNIAAGRLAVGVFGTTAAFAPVQAGRPVSIIACDISGSSSAGIIVKADSRYQSLQDLSGQRVGVIGASGAAFGSAAAYSNYIKQRGGQALSLVVEPNAAAIGAALSSGLVAAAVGQISAHRSAISAGKSRILLEPTSQLTKSIVGSDVCAGAWYGLKSSLNSDPQRREAIRRFVAGLRIAVAAIIKASDAEVAAVLGKSPDFSPSVVSRSDLESQIADSRPFFAQHDGFISPQVWSTSLKAFSTWGLSLGGIDVDVFGPPFTYNSIVDMSYWNAASALVAEHK